MSEYPQMPVLAFWHSLGNYTVKGVVIAVYEDGTWYEQCEFGDNDKSALTWFAIDSTQYEVYQWQPIPEVKR